MEDYRWNEDMQEELLIQTDINSRIEDYQISAYST
jgi:hypothetical protein